MKLEGAEERKLWAETVISILKSSAADIVHSTPEKHADAAIAVADRVALALRARDTSRPR